MEHPNHYPFSERMERTAQRFADSLHENIEARVQLALALERDRFEAELALVREQVADAHRRIDAQRALLAAFQMHLTDNAQHSVRA